MSIEALSWAWKQDLERPRDKIVLVALADAAREDGVCWPKQTTLAAKCSLGVKSVRRALQELEKLGLLTVHKNGKMNIYQLAIGVNLTPMGEEIGVNLTPMEENIGVNLTPNGEGQGSNSPLIGVNLTPDNRTQREPKEQTSPKVGNCSDDTPRPRVVESEGAQSETQGAAPDGAPPPEARICDYDAQLDEWAEEIRTPDPQPRVSVIGCHLDEKSAKAAVAEAEAILTSRPAKKTKKSAASEGLVAMVPPARPTVTDWLPGWALAVINAPALDRLNLAWQGAIHAQGWTAEKASAAWQAQYPALPGGLSNAGGWVVATVYKFMRQPAPDEIPQTAEQTRRERIRAEQAAYRARLAEWEAEKRAAGPMPPGFFELMRKGDYQAAVSLLDVEASK